MRKPAILVTGAQGEIGHALVTRLAAAGQAIVTIDIQPLDGRLARVVARESVGSVTDTGLLERLLAEFEIDQIFHLAALLSTRAEFAPVTAHQVNVDGTLHLLEFAQRAGESHGRPVRFLYPSSIAVYGLAGRDAKARAGRVREDAHAHPVTMYGCNKLYCEELGRYYTRHYKQLSTDAVPRVDFRAVRFPGLISATTLPSGGTSDFASEMVHAAAQSVPYACFVEPDTVIPFMAMPDASETLLQLAGAPRSCLSRTSYNVGAFSVSADRIRELVVAAFPQAEIAYKIDRRRQGIVDSWPADVDDSAARNDWGFQPAYDCGRAFREYLIPAIRDHYAL